MLRFIHFLFQLFVFHTFVILFLVVLSGMTDISFVSIGCFFIYDKGVINEFKLLITHLYSRICWHFYIGGAVEENELSPQHRTDMTVYVAWLNSDMLEDHRLLY